ncbi:phosphatidylinositol-glycan biosynthesis class X protein [Channa argus]|uniref:phosphatidylinositol-glycan biosynthesis class X protein n=1 Tax=Channa argus TaxID=215402 RepID=UPI00351FD56A
MYFLLSLLTCLSICYCLTFIEKDNNENHCDLVRQGLESTSVSVEVSKKGFHREVVTTVSLSPNLISEVRVLLINRWPRGVFVDPYQLASLSDQSDWQFLLDSAIDLEAPAHKTSGFITYMYPTLNGSTPRLLKIAIPIHGRYHEPSFDGKTSTSINIEPPELLLQTKECTKLNSLESQIVDAPCTADNSSMCSWVKMQHQQEYGPMSFQFPVGDGSLVIPVCSGTLLITLLSCAALSKYMWEHQI